MSTNTTINPVNNSVTSALAMTADSFLTLPHSEKHVVSACLAVFFLMGFFGNSVILVIIRGFKPSHQYRPGRLLLIWMFGTDLCLTMLMVFPAMLTSFGWSGLPSESLACTMFGYTETVFAALENLVILVMSLERVFTIYFPLRKILNVRRTNISCVVCLASAICLSSTNLTINRFSYNPDALRCLAEYYPSERAVQLFIAGSTLLFVFVPLVTTVIVYIMIIRMVCKSNQFGHARQSWQAIKTTLLVVGIYLLSVLPFVVSRIYTLAASEYLPLRVRIFATVVYMLNTAVNPYVYLFTNRSLRNHGISLLNCAGKEVATTEVVTGNWHDTVNQLRKSNYYNRNWRKKSTIVQIGEHHRKRRIQKSVLLVCNEINHIQRASCDISSINDTVCYNNNNIVDEQLSARCELPDAAI